MSHPEGATHAGEIQVVRAEGDEEAGGARLEWETSERHGTGQGSGGQPDLGTTSSCLQHYPRFSQRKTEAQTA